MNYWWVNQNQTFSQEFDGGYMWSPKTNSNGGRSEYYLNMTRVVPGDRVFSFKGQRIVALGVIRSKGYSASKPQEFGNAGDNWSDEGWRVDVDYKLLHNKIQPAQNMEHLRHLLPERYSPLQQNGRGNQVYLCAIGNQFAETLLELIDEDLPQVEASEVEVLLDSALAEKLREQDQLTETEVDQITKSRRGQGIFKANLEKIESACRVTGVRNPKHLIASHIKPWSKSNNLERLDGNNGLLLSPHIDHLFDKGHITFSENGDLLISTSADKDALHRWQVRSMNVGGFNENQLAYLQYHRNSVFNK